MNFPCGLEQADGSYRFGLDALLLAAGAITFIDENLPAKIAELGTGCGAALFGVALKRPNARCLGIEREPELFLCAAENALKLGLFERCEFLRANLRDDLGCCLDWQGCCDAVIANPPWRRAQNGRISPSFLRRRALWQEQDTFELFCNAACRLLTDNGNFCVILPENQMKQFVKTAEKSGLHLAIAMPFMGFAESGILRLLLVFGKVLCKETVWHSPLVLYCKAANRTVWTEDALHFCPWVKESL